jgi:hypothetical protein
MRLSIERVRVAGIKKCGSERESRGRSYGKTTKGKRVGGGERSSGKGRKIPL